MLTLEDSLRSQECEEGGGRECEEGSKLDDVGEPLCPDEVLPWAMLKEPSVFQAHHGEEQQ